MINSKNIIMKEVRIPIVEGIYGRLEGLSSILAVDLDKVINMSLIQGLKDIGILFVKSLANFQNGICQNKITIIQ